MGIDDKDLPHIYLFDPQANKTEAYPIKMDKIEDFSPEIIFAWAEYTKAKMDLKRNEEEIVDVEAKGHTDKQFNDEIEYDNYLRHLYKEVEHYKEQVQTLREEYEVIKSENEEHSNAWKEEHEEYFDVAELHLARIEQVMMEEL